MLTVITLSLGLLILVNMVLAFCTKNEPIGEAYVNFIFVYITILCVFLALLLTIHNEMRPKQEVKKQVRIERPVKEFAI